MKNRHLFGAGAAACAVCCAPPLIGLLGLAGFAATTATLAFAGVVFALVVAGASVLALVARRRWTREPVVLAGPVDLTLTPRPEPSAQGDTIAT